MAKKTTVSLEGAVKTDAGVTYKGVVMEPVDEKCEGCERHPALRRRKFLSHLRPARPQVGPTASAISPTHVRAEVDKTGAVKVNPLKASKRAARGR